MKVLYPGTFDPLTYGHLDLIERADKLYDEVLVAVLENSTKSPTFNLTKRLFQIQASTKHLKNVKTISYDGLTVECAKEYQANIILRGLRAMSDFEYELQIAHTNRSIESKIETVFLATETHFSFLSSSVVKEVAKYGGKVDHMVPDLIEKDLKEHFKLKPNISY
tara:strand:- start:21361 stop:21855 length:495 start_codon:yes stop_codon:yes gene_type:complete